MKKWVEFSDEYALSLAWAELGISVSYYMCDGWSVFKIIEMRGEDGYEYDTFEYDEIDLPNNWIPA